MEPLRRDIQSLVRVVREELRAEGADGAGYSDFFIANAINQAMGELSGIYPIRDNIVITTEEGVNEYSIVEDAVIDDVLRVIYDGAKLDGMVLDDYLEVVDKTEGYVRGWLLWGKEIRLVGKVEGNKRLDLWVTRAPNPMIELTDTPETPYYADAAIVQYTIASCYRESKEYERASFHHNIFLHKKAELLQRGVPQGQKGSRVYAKSGYFPPVGTRGRYRRSDTNPGGD